MKRLDPEKLELQRDIGNRIKELRKAINLRSVDLSANIGISQSQLSKIENGKTAISVNTLIKLCRVLDRPAAYFLQREEEIPRVLGTNDAVAGPENRALEWFAARVQQLTDGKMSIHSLRATGTDSSQDQVKLLREGVIDIFIEELIFYQTFTSAVSLTGLPFVFNSTAHLYAYLRSKYFENEGVSAIQSQGIRILNRQWNWHRGIERVLVSTKPILHPDDIKGLRVRTFDIPLVAKFWELMGAEPVIIHWPNVKAAWDNHDFDILPSHKSHLYPMGFCKHGRYVTRLGDVPPVLAVGVNEIKYLSIPPTIQKALRDACDETGDYFSELAPRMEVENETANMTTYEAVYLQTNPIPWRDASRRAITQMVQSGHIPAKTWDLVQALSES